MFLAFARTAAGNAGGGVMERDFWRPTRLRLLGVPPSVPFPPVMLPSTSMSESESSDSSAVKSDLGRVPLSCCFLSIS
jgi:hypothetical protein